MHEKYKVITPISHVPVCHPAIFWDNGDCTFNYEADGDGDDWSAAYNTAAAHSCLKGIRLCTKETSPTSGDVVSISKHLWLPPTQMFTLELLFKNVIELERFDITIGCTWYDGIDDNVALVRLQSSTGRLLRYAGNTSYDYSDILTFCPTWKVWNHLRMSVNLQRQSYQFIELNNHVEDSRAFAIPQGTNPTVAHLMLWLLVSTNTSGIACVDFDHILLMPGNP